MQMMLDPGLIVSARRHPYENYSPTQNCDSPRMTSSGGLSACAASIWSPLSFRVKKVDVWNHQLSVVLLVSPNQPIRRFWYELVGGSDTSATY
jgi:hypothetical protein